MTPPDEKLRALLERLRAMVDSGRFAPGGGTIDANGKVKTWGGEPIKVPRNLDGPEAAAALETLLSRVATLEAALQHLLIAVEFTAPPKEYGTPDDPNPCFECRIPIGFTEAAHTALGEQP